MKFGVGQSVRRKEDDPLLRGEGRYIADFAPPGALHAVLVRSPHAHARFRIDAGKARAAPGVRLVLTAEDVGELGPLPCPVGIPDVAIPVPPYAVLARGEVRHVGDAVAIGQMKVIVLQMRPDPLDTTAFQCVFSGFDKCDLIA